MTAACANDAVTEEEKEYALKILRSFGKVEIVAENMIDAVVAVSGSAPAYVFMFIEAMADAAVSEGMPRKQAYEFSRAGSLRKCKDGARYGKTSGRIKRYGMFSCGNKR